MKRIALFIVADLLAGLTMLGMIASGIVMRFVLPPGSGRRMNLWNWDRHQWGDLHFWLSMAVLAVLVLHVALHWKWVMSLARRPFTSGNNSAPSTRAQFVTGVLTILVLVAGGIGFWQLSLSQVQPSAPLHLGGQAAMHERDDSEIIAPQGPERLRRRGGRDAR